MNAITCVAGYLLQKCLDKPQTPYMFPEAYRDQPDQQQPATLLFSSIRKQE